jgi:hypothetical protein
LATGLFTGVTTSLDVRYVDHALERWLQGSWDALPGTRFDGPVLLPGGGEDPATLIKRGQQLRELSSEVVVKFAAARAGATACAAMAAESAPLHADLGRLGGIEDQAGVAPFVVRTGVN